MNFVGPRLRELVSPYSVSGTTSLVFGVPGPDKLQLIYELIDGLNRGYEASLEPYPVASDGVIRRRIIPVTIGALAVLSFPNRLTPPGQTPEAIQRSIENAVQSVEGNASIIAEAPASNETPIAKYQPKIATEPESGPFDPFDPFSGPFNPFPGPGPSPGPGPGPSPVDSDPCAKKEPQEDDYGNIYTCVGHGGGYGQPIYQDQNGNYFTQTGVNDFQPYTGPVNA